MNVLSYTPSIDEEAFVLDQLLPLPLIENAASRKRIDAEMTRIVIETVIDVNDPNAGNATISVAGSHSDGLAIPDHFLFPDEIPQATGLNDSITDTARAELITSDLDIMTIINPEVKFPGYHKFRIFEVENTDDPVYVRLKITPELKEFVRFENEIDIHDVTHLSTTPVTRKGMETCLEAYGEAGVIGLLIIQGPAVTVDLDTGPTIPNLSFDNVTAFACQRPRSALMWDRRHRRSGWPNKDLIEKVRQSDCVLVPVGPRFADTLQWRYSFSKGESLLGQSLSPKQRKCFLLLKLIKQYFISPNTGTTALSSYHLKTLFFWECEKIPATFWINSSYTSILQYLLCELLHYISTGNLPHYFLERSNLFAKIPPEIRRTLAKSVFQAKTRCYHLLCAIGRRVKFSGITGIPNPVDLYSESVQKFTKCSPVFVSLFKTMCAYLYNIMLQFVEESTDLIRMNIPSKDAGVSMAKESGAHSTWSKSHRVLTLCECLLDILIQLFEKELGLENSSSNLQILRKRSEYKELLINYCAEKLIDFRVSSAIVIYAVSYFCLKLEIKTCARELLSRAFGVSFEQGARNIAVTERETSWAFNFRTTLQRTEYPSMVDLPIINMVLANQHYEIMLRPAMRTRSERFTDETATVEATTKASFQEKVNSFFSQNVSEKTCEVQESLGICVNDLEAFFERYLFLFEHILVG